jgi:hypothetical protein
MAIKSIKQFVVMNNCRTFNIFVLYDKMVKRNNHTPYYLLI